MSITVKAIAALAAAVLMGISVNLSAQNVRLISNFDQTPNPTPTVDDLRLWTHDGAQQFTTGSEPGATGFKINTIKVAFQSGEDATEIAKSSYTASIQNDVAGNRPDGTAIKILTKPDIQAGVVWGADFGADGHELELNKAYWIVINATSQISGYWLPATNKNTEDPGGYHGWSVGNFHALRLWDGNLWGKKPFPLRISVNGCVNYNTVPTVQSAEVNLNVLTLTFDHDLKNQGSDKPQTFHFAVTVGEGANESVNFVTNVAISGRVVTLTLQDRVLKTEDTVNVRYQKPTLRPERRLVRGCQEVENFEQSVTVVSANLPPQYGGGEASHGLPQNPHPVSNPKPLAPGAKTTLNAPNIWSDPEDGKCRGNSGADCSITISVDPEGVAEELRYQDTWESDNPERGKNSKIHFQFKNDCVLANTPGVSTNPLIAAVTVRATDSDGEKDVRYSSDIREDWHPKKEHFKATMGCPRLQTGTLSGSTVTLTYEGDADKTISGLAAGQFKINGGTAGDGISSVGTPTKSGTTTTVVVELDSDVSTSTLRLTHNPPTTPTSVGFTDHTLTDGDDPTLSSASIKGDTVSLTFSEALDTSSIPAASRFTGSFGSRSSTGISDTVSISGSVVTLRMSPPAHYGDTVTTISYTRPNSNPIQDSSGRDAAGFTNRTLTNDTIAASVTATEIISTPAHDTDGDTVPDTYGNGEKIQVQLTFGTAVTVTGAPRLKIQLFNEKWAAYESGSGSPKLVFAYTVVPSNEMAEGVGVKSHSLVLNGGTIKDGATDATLLNPGLPRDADHRVDYNLESSTTPPPDTTPPAFSSAILDGDQLAITFDEALDGSRRPSGNAFTATVAGTDIAGSMNPVSIASAKVSVQLATPARHGDTVTVSYAAPSGNPLQDAAGNDVVSFSNQTVTNNTPQPSVPVVKPPVVRPPPIIRPPRDTTPPSVSSTVALSDTLTITFNETLDTGSVPPLTAFAVLADQVSAVLSSVAISGQQLVLMLQDGVVFNQAIRVEYTRPIAHNKRLQDAAGNPVANFDEVAVNETLAIQPVANAGEDMMVDPGLVTLDGSASTDPDDRSLRYTWTQVSGTTVTLERANTAMPQFQVDLPEILVFRLTVQNPDGLSVSDNVMVTVRDTPPTFDTDIDVPSLSLISGEPLEAINLPQASGGNGVLDYSLVIRPSLAGIIFDSATQSLSGTSVETGRYIVEYMVHDADTNREIMDAASMQFEIIVMPRDVAPSFNQAIPTLSLAWSEPMEPHILPEASGGNGSLIYSVKPRSEVAGLHFDPQRRMLSGIPEKAGTHNFDYIAHDSDLNRTDEDAAILSFVVEVLDLKPKFVALIPTIELILEEPIEPVILPEAISGNGAIIYSLESEPEGLAGLQFDPISRTLSGTPTETGTHIFMYRASDSDANRTESDSAMLTHVVTVRDLKPQFIDTMPTLDLVADDPIEPIILPGAVGGNGAILYSLRSNPAGLAGLDFDARLRRLSGTPTTAGAYVFTLRAEDSDTNFSDADAAEISFTARVADSPRNTLIKDTLTQALTAVARRALTSTLESIGTRFAASIPSSTLTVAGRAMPLTSDGRFCEECSSTERNVSMEELFQTSGFSLALSDLNNRRFSNTLYWALWGRGDIGSFTGAPKIGVHYDGKLHTAWIGMDVRTEDWMGGLAISHGIGKSDYRFDVDDNSGAGEISTSLTSLYPYGSWLLSDKLKLKGVLGTGSGSVKHKPTQGREETSHLSMQMGSIGLQYELPSTTSVDLALRTEATAVRMETEKGAHHIDGLTASHRRLRAGVEAARAIELSKERTLAPFVEAAARRDIGSEDADGLGLEIVGGVRYLAPRLQLEARGRWLALHSEDHLKESGLSMTARMGPGAHDRGMFFTVRPQWGAGTSSTALWIDGHPSASPLAASVRMEVGYGFGVVPYGLQGTLTPFAEVQAADSGTHHSRLGARFKSPLINMELASVVRDSTVDHRVRIDVHLQF